MNIGFEFNGASFVSGFLAAYVVLSGHSLIWLILAFTFLFSVEVKGWPYIDITYKSGEGWKVIKGTYK